MKKRSEIRVILADDNPAFRRAFLEILRRNSREILVVAEAVNGEELLSLSRTTPADVFVALGYVLKESAAQDIVQAVIEVNRGGSWSSPPVR
jgi:DNA-binding NarL/FixJ family response regulator